MMFLLKEMFVKLELEKSIFKKNRATPFKANVPPVLYKIF